MTEYNPASLSGRCGGPEGKEGGCGGGTELVSRAARPLVPENDAGPTVVERLQRELALAQERFRRLYEQTPLGYLTLNAQGWICELNPAAAGLLAEAPAALVGRPLAGFLVASDRHRFLSHLRAALQLRQEVMCELVLDAGTLPSTVVQLRLSPPPMALESPPLVYATLQDLSPLRQTEEALRQSEVHFQATWASAGVGIAHVALDGRCLWANAHFARMLGYREEELVRRPFLELTHPEDRPVQQDRLAALAEGKIPHDTEERRLLHQEGHLVWVEATALLQRDSHGEPSYSIHVLQDISGRKRTETRLKALAESLEQRAAERTALAAERALQLRQLAAQLTETEQRERRRLAQLLHDHLQQNLVALRLKLHRLCRDTSDAQLLNDLQELDALLNESIDSSRGLTYELSPPILHHAGLNAALVWLARWTEDKHGLSVAVLTDSQAEPAEETPRLLLFYGVRELLFNVVKHAQTNQARVEVSRRADQIQIVVSDDGVGFDPAHAERSSQSTCGFGLSSVRERLGWLGGGLEVVAAPGQGTRITLRIPDRPAPDASRPEAVLAAP